MTAHQVATFNNGCIRQPIGRLDRRPVPCFERPASYVRLETPLQNAKLATTGALLAGSDDGKSTTVPLLSPGGASSAGSAVPFGSPRKPPQQRCRRIASAASSRACDKSAAGSGGDGVFCMADFFDSIPDYNDINHLSEHDFYGKLDVLKRKQAQLNEACFRRNTAAHRDVVPHIRVNSCDDIESISTPCVVAAASSALERCQMRRSKSADSCRPLTTSCEDVEEQRILHDLMLESRCAFRPDDQRRSPAKVAKTNVRKSHKIPATSKYPMYDQIVADQEKRSQLVRLNSMLELQSKIKPFHFATDKTAPPPPEDGVDDEIIHNNNHPNNSSSTTAIIGHLYTPTPDPFAYKPHAAPQPSSSSSSKTRRFRARPCPRKLFSNYFYHKAWEEEQFRALNHRLRADELLQLATTPPSLRKSLEMRKKRAALSAGLTTEQPLTEHLSAAASPSSLCSNNNGPTRRHGRHHAAKRSHGKAASKSTASGAANDFVTTCTHPFRFETTRRCAERKSMTTATESLASESLAATEKGRRRGAGRRSSPQFLRSTPAPVYPAARPNLAAQLRAEWARKKICDMSCGGNGGGVDVLIGADKAAVIRSTGGGSRTPSWGVRKMPGWKSLYYDHTNDEDISLRLSTRRAEERLRRDEHAISMELMRQRVRATPLLLEGVPQLPTTATAGRHRQRCNRVPDNHAICAAAAADRTKSGRGGGSGSMSDDSVPKGRRSAAAGTNGGRAASAKVSRMGRQQRCGRSTAETDGCCGDCEEDDMMRFRRL